MDRIKRNRDNIALGAVLLLAAVLSIWGIWKQGYGNEFYAAGVKSMLTSWKNFFFVSLDSSGFVTVDKPPVSLWIQALFAKIFGFYGWSIILPQGLSAVASTFIIHKTVKRHFGNAAGLISALALALSPIFIAVARTNNTDSILILFMTLAAWAMMLAADKGSFKWLSLSVIFLAIAYNAKTLQAFLILPALFAGYFFTANTTWKKRFLHMLAAAIILTAVSLSWSIAVDLTPADQRPYVDNSTTNSELELALNYNGLQRLTGMNRGGAPSNSGEIIAPGSGNTSRGSSEGSIEGSDSSTRESNGALSRGTAFPNIGAPGNNQRIGGGFFSHGAQSLIRIFNSNLGGQNSWLLVFGFFAILMLLIQMRKKNESDKEKRMLLLRNAIIWGGSVLTMYGWFSVASFYHEYYIATMAPFLAALVGIGATQMWKLFKEEKNKGYMLTVSFASAMAVQIIMLTYWPSYAAVLIPSVLILSGIPIAALTALKIRKKELAGKIPNILFVIALSGLLLTPAVWTGYSLVSRVNSMLPTAGPSSKGIGGIFGRMGAQANTRGSSGRTVPDRNLPDAQRGYFEGGYFMPEAPYNGSGFSGLLPPEKEDASAPNSANRTRDTLTNYLLKNYDGEKWLVAVPDSNTAAPLILATDKAVMSVGGFGGGSKILTVSSLEKMVQNRELRYFLISGMAMRNDEITAWVKQHGKAVSYSEYGGSSSLSLGGTLYDLSAYLN